MTKKDKLLIKFLKNPTSLRYSEIENLLLSFGFIIIEAKGSHKKFKHTALEKDIIIPIHNNKCKDFYKKSVSKIIKQKII